jgi:opacity protein-like surface antigen
MMTCSRKRLSQGAGLSFFLIVLALCASGWMSRAEAAGGNFGFHLGYSKDKDAASGNTLIGAHGELRIIPWLGVQGSADYRQVQTFDVSTPSGSGELNVRSVPLTVSGRFYVPLLNVSPFALVGAGWYHLIYDYSPSLEQQGAVDASQNTFGWHVGAGVDIQVAPRLSVYGEGRAVFLDPARTLDSSVLSQVAQFDYNSTYVAGGLSFHF